MQHRNPLLATGVVALLGGAVALGPARAHAAPANDTPAQPAAGATGTEQATATSGTDLGEIFFRFDSSALAADTATRLTEAVAFARANPTTRLVLDAHCDPRGTEAYNVGLAIRRAEAVRGQLLRMGVDPDQVVIAVYGEDGTPRATYAEDRRVSIWPTEEPLAMVIDKTFEGAGTAVKWQEPLTVAQIDGREPTPLALRAEEPEPRQPR